MSTNGHPLDARGQKVLRRAVRMWRDMAPDADEYRRGILRGYVLALSALWNVDDSHATMRVRELANGDFALEPVDTVTP